VVKLITNIEVPVLTEKILLANYALQTVKDVGSGNDACMTSEKNAHKQGPCSNCKGAVLIMRELRTFRQSSLRGAIYRMPGSGPSRWHQVNT